MATSGDSDMPVPEYDQHAAAAGTEIAPEPPAPITDEEDARSVSVGELRAHLVNSIRSGMTLTEDVYDENGVLLLASGSQITHRFLQLLRERGVSRVRLGQASPAPGERRQPRASVPIIQIPDADPDEELSLRKLQTQHSRSLDDKLAGELQRTFDTHSVPAWRRPKLSIDNLKAESARGIERHEATSQAVAGLCDSLKAGHKVSADQVRQGVNHFVSMAAVDFDLLPTIVALQQSGDEYLYDHCVNVSLLSMAVASQLGMDQPTIAAVGLGAMLQDIGMLRVPESIRLTPDPLGPREWHEIYKHPLHTLDMLSEMRGLPQVVKFISYQAHERIDGSGYPRQRQGRQVHQLARIVSIADVFAAMTRDRPYREAVEPYLAARAILVEGSSQKFDAMVVRGLLDTVSMFPIGSCVELSSGGRARVLRANPGQHTKPVVEGLAKDGTPTGEVIDLSDEDTPKIVDFG